jgi:hypothetical protein
MEPIITTKNVKTTHTSFFDYNDLADIIFSCYSDIR